jgi:hypothetical protein
MSERRANTAGQDEKRIIHGSVEEYDAAYAKLSRSMKEFLAEHDPGGFSAVAVLKAVETYGEANAKKLVLINRNAMTRDAYGEKHPQYDPTWPKAKR